MLKQATGDLFSIMSYNILADCYVRVPNQPWSKSYIISTEYPNIFIDGFPFCADEFLDWNRRRSAISEELKSYQADIVCLQEVMFEKIDGTWRLPLWLSDFLSLGYEGVMQGLKQKEIQKNSVSIYLRMNNIINPFYFSYLIEFVRKGILNTLGGPSPPV